MTQNLPDLTGKNSKFSEISEIMKNPAMKARLISWIDEAIKCKQKIAVQQENIKRIREDAQDELGLKPAIFNQYAAMAFNNDYTTRKQKHEELVELIDYIISDSTLIPMQEPVEDDE